ncbi:TetR/AcrR family transcriptional regulator [Yinghuangia seranimata]|uniref:TetR/AcrR family transcriptional regulator n=1 Tax=Yinghuangia seranimata TaxID=408067 RepID=UPI00248B48F1|nr:TetR family transcriptional regulator [Yinghuangia seranimata]MDI2130710.1 TetR family transcriptional regulator [Yinghuangia seranimata]
MTAEQTPAGEHRARRAPAAHGRRRDPERTKALILDAATEEFAAKGFAGARVSEIAARAGVNQQLIVYYFDGKEGLYRAIGRRWRAYEAEAFPAETPFADLVRDYVRASADVRLGGRLLAWEGLADTGVDRDEEDARERHARLRVEIDQLRERQEAGELDPDLDPAALHLILTGAANALAVYPHLARGLFGADAAEPDVVEHYAEQLAAIVARLAGPAPE